MNDMDYLSVLQAVKDIPFGVGKKRLCQFLQGKNEHESIKRNKLDKKESFGSLAYSDAEITPIIDSLLINKLLVLKPIPGNRFAKVIEITEKGEKELKDPQQYKKKLSFSAKDHVTQITDEDKAEFAKYSPLLDKFNDEQKKAMISSNPKILCIAGAGSGKTTVLTKRINYQVRFRKADPSKILAITFTRKARQEMQERIAQKKLLGPVQVETFNSYCEKLLKLHNDKLYDKPVRVISYKDKFTIINKALAKQNMTMDQAIFTYFTVAQRRGKTENALRNIFINDCFFVRDYFKSKNIIPVKSHFTSDKHTRSAELMYNVCIYVDWYMGYAGLRDFTDQLLDTIRLFEKHPELKPDYEHILVDEYQDVNSTQIHFLKLLSPKNLFCVGDPRQSIYGWRGSDISYILNFEEEHPGCEIIALTKNYRSTKTIVDFCNKAISSMGLPDLESMQEGAADVHVMKFRDQSQEQEFVRSQIVQSTLPKGDIFILARTNKQLVELSKKLHDIPHVVRSEDKRAVEANENQVTLATVHAIKGLEASLVFCIGCNSMYYPCKGSEHPVIDMIKVDEYDKEEEERRLFYVALSRAKKTLYVTHTSTPTHYLTKDMLSMVGKKQTRLTKENKITPQGTPEGAVARLKTWRKDLAKNTRMPAYMILHDKTILEIVARMPLSLEELEEVPGLGAMKIKRYGEDILNCL